LARRHKGSVRFGPCCAIPSLQQQTSTYTTVHTTTMTTCKPPRPCLRLPAVSHRQRLLPHESLSYGTGSAVMHHLRATSGRIPASRCLACSCHRFEGNRANVAHITASNIMDRRHLLEGAESCKCLLCAGENQRQIPSGTTFKIDRYSSVL
jgi:hypothetical protein